MSTKTKRLAALFKGIRLPNRYTFDLRPSEITFVETLEKHEAVGILSMIDDGIDENSIRVMVSRLRKKLPKDVIIKTKYGGYYYLTDESKHALKKYKRT